MSKIIHGPTDSFFDGRKVKDLNPQPKINMPSLTPRDIKAKLDEFIIGQEKAKKIIAVAAYKHLMRVANDLKGEPFKPFKNNVILIGPTGTGKTYICEKLAEILKIPFAIIDVSSITQSGYVGGSTNEIMDTLIAKSNAIFDSDKGANYGIVMLDELDKLAGDPDNVGRGAVQQELLKIIEGKDFTETFSTKNVLFIGAGAFGNEIHEDKVAVVKEMGFGGGEEETQIPINDQLINFGLMPEIVGRFQVGTCLHELTKEDLSTILTESKESIMKNTMDLFKFEGMSLRFTRGAIEEISEVAIKKGTGARALNSIIELILSDLQYELLGSRNGDKVVITKKTIQSVVV